MPDVERFAFGHGSGGHRSSDEGAEDAPLVLQEEKVLAVEVGDEAVGARELGRVARWEESDRVIGRSGGGECDGTDRETVEVAVLNREDSPCGGGGSIERSLDDTEAEGDRGIDGFGCVEVEDGEKFGLGSVNVDRNIVVLADDTEAGDVGTADSGELVGWEVVEPVGKVEPVVVVGDFARDGIEPRRGGDGLDERSVAPALGVGEAQPQRGCRAEG